jgi:tRNA pseudouridine55 synthase
VKNIIVLNKKEGETPLEALEKFRKKHKEYKDIKMTYAGRLDPMASGVLVVLAGGEVYNKEKYLKLNKEYDFEVLFGFSTDTYDILGKVTSFLKPDLTADGLAEKIEKNLKYFKGKFTQQYPIYSSKKVLGKQLFVYGREGFDVDLPEHRVYVKSLKFLKLRKINSKKLLSNIEKRINKVNGDFRQNDISKIWNKNLKQKQIGNLFIGSFKIKCGSGTYVRSIANSLGHKINIPALAFSIKRTKLGKWGRIV